MYLFHSIIHKVERVKLDFLKIVTLYQHNGVELSRHTTRLVTLSVVVVEIRMSSRNKYYMVIWRLKF